MRQTIKQWCRTHDVGWLGQGATGGMRYDWKIVLGKGRTAIFASTVSGPLPEVRRIGERNVLFFPNVNRGSRGDKISEGAFLRIISWVEDCMAGNVRELEAPNTTPDGICQPAAIYEGAGWTNLIDKTEQCRPL